MAEHSELVSEMAILEKLGTQERLKMAKKRRMQQLKKWSQREKEFTKEQTSQTKKHKKTDLNNEPDCDKPESKRRRTDRVHFVPSVMLLEAAARNDIDEGRPERFEQSSQTTNPTSVLSATVRRLLMMKVDPDSTNEDGLTALHQVSIYKILSNHRLCVDVKCATF